MANATDNYYPNFGAVIVAVFMESLGAIFAVTLNVFHLTVLTYNTSLFTVNLRLCLRILAACDIFGGLICYGLAILNLLKGTAIRSSLIRCNVAVAICTTFLGFSQFILFIITIARYVAVAHPLQYYNKLTVRRIKISVLSALMFGATLGVGRSVNVARIGKCDFNGYDELCIHRMITIYQTVPLFLVVVTTVLNVRVLCIARAQMKRDKTARHSNITLESCDSNDAHNKGKNSVSERLKSAITISAVVGANYLVWMPYFMKTLVCISLNQNQNLGLEAVVYWLLYSNFWLNPIVFGLVNKTYKKAVLRLIRRAKLFLLCES